MAHIDQVAYGSPVVCRASTKGRYHTPKQIGWCCHARSGCVANVAYFTRMPAPPCARRLSGRSRIVLGKEICGLAVYFANAGCVFY